MLKSRGLLSSSFFFSISRLSVCVFNYALYPIFRILNSRLVIVISGSLNSCFLLGSYLVNWSPNLQTVVSDLVCYFWIPASIDFPLLLQII